MSDKKSIYIHIPFCVKKCVYCDFYSDTHLSLIPEFIQSLLQEIQLRAVKEKNTSSRIDTIYFGGGTPSLLGLDHVNAVLHAIKNEFDVAANAEVTCEVNPGTIDAEYLNGLKALGVNRLSIGVQSFDPEKLLFLKRIHTVDQSVSAIEAARNAGFENISIDLIYGLPFEKEPMWDKDLRNALEWMLPHLSCYMLTVEPGTPLGEMVGKKRIQPSDTEKMTRLFEKTVNTLGDNGYEHYEISSFSQGPHLRSKHNSRYWQMKPYLGFGPAAHSYDTDTRFWNVPDVNAYIHAIGSGQLAVQETETLTNRQKMMEMIMLGLRTKEGIDLQRFNAIFDPDFEHHFGPLIRQVCDEDLARICDQIFFLTLAGKTRINSIVDAFAQKIL